MPSSDGNTDLAQEITSKGESNFFDAFSRNSKIFLAINSVSVFWYMKRNCDSGIDENALLSLFVNSIAFVPENRDSTTEIGKPSRSDTIRYKEAFLYKEKRSDF